MKDISKRISRKESKRISRKQSKRIIRQAAVECPADWDLNGDYCYYISGEKLSYAGAQTNCEEMDAMLASIHSYEEQDFIIGNNYKIISLFKIM